MLLERQQRILEFLRTNRRWITGRELASIISVSDRTIRNDILNIKNELGEDIIVTSKRTGYKYNSDNIEDQDVEVQKEIYGQAERSLYIIKKLLVNENGVNIYHLAERLFISEVTIESDLYRLKKIISEIHLNKVNLLREGEIIRIENNEEYTNNLFYDIAKYEKHDFEIDDIKKYFKNLDLNLLSDIIVKEVHKHKYFSRYLSMMNLVIDIAISITKSKKSNSTARRKNSYKNIQFEEFKLATELVREVENNFYVNISEGTILHLANNLFRIKKIEQKENEVRECIIEEDGVYKFYKRVFNNIKSDFGIDFTECSQITRDISIHTKIAIERIKLGIKLYNPLTEQLKNQYPFLFNIAIYLSEELSKENEVVFELDETSYLVAYLGAAFQQIRKSNNLDVLLIVLEGTSNLNYIYDQITKLSKDNYINIVGISSLYELEKLEGFKWNFDLIISTSNIPNLNYDDYLIIKSSFNIADKIMVKELINKKRVVLLENQFEDMFNNYFAAELFFTGVECSNKEEVIEFIVDELKEKGYVEEEFKQSVMEREKYVSTAMQTGVALPHGMKQQAIKSGVAVAILKNPVNWEGNKVKLVFLTALSKDNIKYIDSYNDCLTDIAMYNDISSNIKKSKSFLEFKELVRKFYLDKVI